MLSMGAIVGLLGGIVGVMVMLVAFFFSHMRTEGTFKSLHNDATRQFALYLLVELFVATTISFAFRR